MFIGLNYCLYSRSTFHKGHNTNYPATGHKPDEPSHQTDILHPGFDPVSLIQLDELQNLYYPVEEYRGATGPYDSFKMLSAAGTTTDLISPVLNRDWFLGESALADPAGTVYFPGREGILKRTPQGHQTLLAIIQPHSMTTMAMAPDGSILVTDRDALHRISKQGEITMLANKLHTSPPDDPCMLMGDSITCWDLMSLKMAISILLISEIAEF